MNKLKLDEWLVLYRNSFVEARDACCFYDEGDSVEEAETYLSDCVEVTTKYGNNPMVWAHFHGRVVGTRLSLERLRNPLK